MLNGVPMLLEVVKLRLPVKSAVEISALGGKLGQVISKVLLVPKAGKFHKKLPSF